jgi:hypothetical protein
MFDVIIKKIWLNLLFISIQAACLSSLHCANLTLTHDEVYLIQTHVIKLVSDLSGDVVTIVSNLTCSTHYISHKTSLEALKNLI